MLVKTKQAKVVSYHTRGYCNPQTLMPGAVFIYQGKHYVLLGTANEGRYYRAVGQGKKNFPSKDCNVVKQNIGLVYLYE